MAAATSAVGAPVTEVAKLVASDGAADDWFGSVSMSGDTVVIGAYMADVDGRAEQGAVYIFDRNAGGADNWGQVKKLTAPDGAASDYFGAGVSISGDTVMVSAIGADVDGKTDQGAVYIFERNVGGPGNWGQVKKLTASDGAADDRFGSASIDGDTAVVGTCWADVDGKSNQGAAYVSERNAGGSGNWGQVRKLIASDGGSVDGFGAPASIDGDIIVAGAFGDNTYRGSAYVFYRNRGGADNWGEVAKLTASDGAAHDWFGVSARVSGDTVVIGANSGSNYKGSAYVYERNSGGPDAWGEVKTLTATDPPIGKRFGTVSICGDTIVVGARRDEVGGNVDQGSAYVFQRNAGGPGAWGEVAKFTASDGAANDCFGGSISIDGSTVVAGASMDDVGGNANQGSAYVFRVNLPPMATDDGGSGFITDEDMAFTTINVLANDTDPDASDTLAVTGVGTTGTLGQVTDNGDGTFGYDPTVSAALQALATGESMDDTFTYTVSDGNGGTDTATVTITVNGVNDAPDAVDDDYPSDFVTDEDTVFTENVISVLDNDGDAEGDALAVSGCDPTSVGGASVTVSPDGTFAYDPSGAAALQALAVGESTTDTFTYTASDGNGGTDAATVTITVNGVNDAPTAVDDGGAGFETDKDTAFRTAGVLANDTDPDASDALSVAALDAAGTLGLVSDNGDGTFGYDPNGQFDALAWNESAMDTFTYTVTDGNGGTDTATVTVTVTGANEPRSCGEGGCGAGAALAFCVLTACLALRRRGRQDG